MRDTAPPVLEVITVIGTLLALCASMATHPHECPPGWFARDGVREDGRFTCQRPPPGGEDFGPDSPGTLSGSIECTGGARPIVGDDGRTIGCQR